MARMQFEFSERYYDEIRKLMESCGFETQKELFNNALTLMKWAVRHVSEGHTVAAVDPAQERYFELEMPFLALVRDQAEREPRERESPSMG